MDRKPRLNDKKCPLDWKLNFPDDRGLKLLDVEIIDGFRSRVVGVPAPKLEGDTTTFLLLSLRP